MARRPLHALTRRELLGVPVKAEQSDARSSERSFKRRVHQVVRRIPRGRVATYGQVAAIAGRPRAARAVGTALARLSAAMATVVPWHRVVNAAGAISRRDPDAMTLQRELLEREGVRLKRGGRVDLATVQWRGTQARTRR